MRKRYFKLVLCFYLLSIFSAYAQEKNRLFFGRVVDKYNHRIPDVSIYIKGISSRFNCDTNGYFFFEIDTANDDRFIFYKEGYGKKELSRKNFSYDSTIVILDELNYSLNEVRITGKDYRYKQAILGKQKLKHNGSCYMIYGDEVAIFLSADESKNGILEEVFVYITGEGIPDSKFKIHIYEKDSLVETPWFEIADTIVSAKKGNEWVKVNLSEKRIPIKNGVFISVEWINGYGNSDKAWYQEKLLEYKVAKINTRHFNGQVLGLTWDYGVRNIMYRSYKNSRDSWRYHNISGTGKKRGGIRIDHWINPMIYATYTYRK